MYRTDSPQGSGQDDSSMNLELITISDGNPSSKEYRKVFNHDGGTIGRDRACDFILPCDEKLVSRVHAEINCRDGQFFIRDSSANGVFINAMMEPVGYDNQHELNDGDVIGIGNHALKVVVSSISPIAAGLSINNPASNSSSHSSGAGNNHSVVSKHGVIETGVIQQPTKATVHQLPVSDSSKPMIEVEDPIQNRIEKNRSDLGDASDNFVAPKFTIPQDWDIDIDDQALSTSPINAAPPVETPRFNEQEQQLLEKLLQGLGADKFFSASQITPEAMTNIGRSLRIAINGTLNNRQQLHETKSALSQGEITLERQMESDALGDIGSIEGFIKAMIDPHHALNASLPQLLATSYIQSAEDQKDIFEGVNVVKEQIEAGLSPSAIESAYQQFIQRESQSSPPLNKLGEKFSQGSKKWNFYRHHWKKMCEDIAKNIHKHFESKILLAHAKRIRDKNNANR